MTVLTRRTSCGCVAIFMGGAWVAFHHATCHEYKWGAPTDA
jgi:hypothetical protein